MTSRPAFRINCSASLCFDEASTLMRVTPMGKGKVDEHNKGMGGGMNIDEWCRRRVVLF